MTKYEWIIRLLITAGVLVLFIPLLVPNLVAAWFTYCAISGDGSTSASLTCGDLTTYEWCEPSHEKECIWGQGHQSNGSNSIDRFITVEEHGRKELVNDLTVERIAGYRSLPTTLIGASRSGYFIFDNAARTATVYAHHDQWMNDLRKLSIAPNTLLLPGPIRESYEGRGWLGSHINPDKEWYQ